MNHTDIEKIIAVINKHAIYGGRLLIEDVSEKVAAMIFDNREELKNQYEVFIVKSMEESTEAYPVFKYEENAIILYTEGVPYSYAVRTVAQSIKLPLAAQNRINGRLQYSGYKK